MTREAVPSASFLCSIAPWLSVHNSVQAVDFITQIRLSPVLPKATTP